MTKYIGPITLIVTMIIIMTGTNLMSSSEIVVPWEPRLLKRRMLRKSYLLEATQKRFLIT